MPYAAIPCKVGVVVRSWQSVDLLVDFQNGGLQTGSGSVFGGKKLRSFRYIVFFEEVGCKKEKMEYIAFFMEIFYAEMEINEKRRAYQWPM